jgi:hypothetical protein
MTDNKEIREQIAFQDARVKRPGAAQRGERGGGSGSAGAVRMRQRVVTTPHAIVHPAGWTAMAQRRERQRRSAEPSVVDQGGRPLVARSLGQTAVRASSGQMRAVRPEARKPLPVRPIPRRSSRRRRPGGRLWKMLAGLLVLLIAGVGSAFALAGPAFRIQQVTVVGTQNRALIAQIQHLGMQGQNIFLVDTQALSRRIAALPLVASASVERTWPDQLQVTVSERQPVLLWQTRHGSYSVDRSGVVMAPASSTPGASHLRTVVDMRDTRTTAGIQPGAHLDARTIAFANQIFQSASALTGINTFILRYESKIYVSNAGPSADQMVSHATFVIASPAGWVAYLGGPDDANPLVNRLRELQRILVMAQQKGLHLATIDLRFGPNVAYTLQP